MRVPLKVMVSVPLALLLGASCLDAQQRSQTKSQGRGGRVPVLVVMVDSLQAARQPFLIVRRPSQSGPDAIVLPHGAGADALSAGVRAMMLTRRQGGDTAAAPMLVRAHGSARGLSRVLPWTPRVLLDVRGAPLQPFGRYGPAHVVQIWLPRTHGRR
jgi:hypothetical protein